MKKFKYAAIHMSRIIRRGGTIHLGVKVEKMSRDKRLNHRKYDRILFNQPTIGGSAQQNEKVTLFRNNNLVRTYFRWASRMVLPWYRGGEIHISHKDTGHYKNWEIEKTGKDLDLQLLDKIPFFNLGIQTLYQQERFWRCSR